MRGVRRRPKAGAELTRRAPGPDRGGSDAARRTDDLATGLRALRGPRDGAKDLDDINSVRFDNLRCSGGRGASAGRMASLDGFSISTNIRVAAGASFARQSPTIRVTWIKADRGGKSGFGGDAPLNLPDFEFPVRFSRIASRGARRRYANDEKTRRTATGQYNMMEENISQYLARVSS